LKQISIKEKRQSELDQAFAWLRA